MKSNNGLEESKLVEELYLRTVGSKLKRRRNQNN